MDVLIPLELSGELVVIVVILAVIFVSCAVFGFIWMKKRREGVKILAQELGLDLEPKLGQEVIERLKWSHLFNLGTSPGGRHHLHGTLEGIESELFDYQYSVHTGEYGYAPQWTSVVHLRSPSLSLPTFTMQPKSGLGKLAKLGKKSGGSTELNLSSKHEWFSKHIQVEGGDAEAIRRLFSGELIDFLQDLCTREKQLCVEGHEQGLIVYRQNRVVKTGGLRAFLELARSVFNEMVKATT